MKHLPLQCDQVEYSSVSISRGKRTLFQAIENTKIEFGKPPIPHKSGIT